MEQELKKIVQLLIDLDKRMEEFDESIKNARFEIHNTLWELIELRKSIVSKENKRVKIQSI